MVGSFLFMTPSFAVIVVSWYPAKYLADAWFPENHLVQENLYRKAAETAGSLLKLYGQTLRIGVVPMTIVSAAFLSMRGKDFLEVGDRAIEPVSTIIVASIIMDLWGHLMQKMSAHF